MKFRMTRMLLIAAVVACSAGASLAAVSLNVTPGSIDTHHVGDVRLEMTSVVGSSVVLRLFVDADGDGVIDPEDYPIWTDVIEDDLPEFSPGMFSDIAAGAGAITVDLRQFGPLEFPYSVGEFIWQAVDGLDVATGAFEVTQASLGQFVSGTVTDSVTATPLPNALVVLEPFCDQGEEAMRFYSAFSDESGSYAIELPTSLDCTHRLLLVVRPGYVGTALGQPHLVFTGANGFTNQDVALIPGDRSVSGALVYETGPRIGQGIPGLPVWAFVDEIDGWFSVAYTDENGDFTLTVLDGAWAIEAPEERANSRGIVGSEDEFPFSVSGLPLDLADIALPAANAFLEGVLYDDSGSPLAGRWVSADRSWPCDPDCYYNETLTRTDGSFTIGVVAPAGPATADYSLGTPDPIPGLIAEQRTCETLSENQILTGRDLHHVAPTGFITGKLMRKNGQALESTCLDAWGGGGSCLAYRAAAMSTCDGTYSMPVIDGQWNLRLEPEDFAGVYRDLDDMSVNRQVTVGGGGGQSGVDFIVGGWQYNPTITFIEPMAGPAGSHVQIKGHGFSLGSMPDVFFGATQATVLGFRPDLGSMVVEVPGALSPGNHDVTVVNADLGRTSDPACFEVTGSFVPACTISGTVDDPGAAAPVPDTFVMAYGDDGDSLVRIALTDPAGDFTLDLDAPGDYVVVFVPPQGQPWSWGQYFVSCGTPLDHTFAPGWHLTGRVADEFGEGLANALVEVEEIEGSGSYAFTQTDDDGAFSLHVPGGTFEVFVEPPPGSRFTAPSGAQAAVSGDMDLGEFTMSQGYYFCANVHDPRGDGVAAEIEAFRKDDDSWAGFADTNSCTGRFDLALPAGEYRLDIFPDTLDVDGPTQVKWIQVGGDTLAGFDFTVFDRAGLQHTGPEARIQFVEPDPAGQVGQPMQIFAVNLGGTLVDVMFSDGAGGFVPGDVTVWDPARGIVTSRVPSDAADGEMKLVVDGLESPGVAFTLLPEPFPAGVHPVSGTVSGPGGPVDGVFVGLFRTDPLSDDCDEEDGILIDYGMTGPSGAYGPLTHPGGDFQVVFLPPAGTTLAPATDERLASFAPEVIDSLLADGVPVHLRAVDDDPVPNPVPGVVFGFFADGPEDWRLTDTNGDVTLYMPPGDYEFELIPPPGSRLLEQEWSDSIAGSTDYLDRTLVKGVMVGSAVSRLDDGSPVQGALVEAQRDGDPWDFYFESLSSVHGVFQGPVPSGTNFQLLVEPLSDQLEDFRAFGLTAGANDCIFYPSLELGAAGFVEGLVRDAATLLPLADVQVVGMEDDLGAPGEWISQTRTCPDGTYRLKLPARNVFLETNGWPPNPRVSKWYPDAYCGDAATPLALSPGGTSSADFDLELAGEIHGTVRWDGAPVQDVSACTSSATLDGCYFCNSMTDAEGNYTLSVPQAPDHRVEVSDPALGHQCYDGFDDCSGGFTPVAVTSGSPTNNIDFDFAVCSSDLDDDSVCDTTDNCPTIPNPLQIDTDSDGRGDLCDICPGGDDGSDADADGTPDFCDACPGDAGKTDPGQCGCGTPDTDSDADGAADCIDICEGGNDGADADADGTPDFCDVCPGGDDGADADADGTPDFCDACPGGDDGADADADGTPDFCDVCPGGDDGADADADGTPDFCDACPGDAGKTDPGQCGCGTPDTDSDADGAADCIDICEGGNDGADADADGTPDFCDVCPGGDDGADADADGTPDFCDACPGDAGKIDPGQCGCGTPDAHSDADGVVDCVDNCPGVDNANQVDTDLDLQGDACDDDDDDDGVLDVADNCPLLPNTGQYDRDGDLLGNVCDPTLVDFAPAGSSVPPGFLHADGSSYSSTTGHGWSQPVETRERASGGPAELKTFAFTQGVRHWTIEMLNGEYVVTVVLGDPSYPQGTQRVLANGVVVLDGVSTAASEFAEFEATVHVRNGLLELEVGGGSGLTTLNVLKIVAPDVPDEGISVNFQTPTAEVPDGYVSDTGQPYAGGFGWVVPMPTRERFQDVPQVRDTFVYSVLPETWELDILPGVYEVLVTAGDPTWAQGPQQVVVEGTTAIDGILTTTASFAEALVLVHVTDGKLTVVIGGAGGLTTINQITVRPAPEDADGDGAPNSSDNCPLISNPAQLDQDSDGRGDPCDVCPNDSNDDSDGDGVCGDVDNCAVLPNPGQENLDGDAQGDLCDPCPADADNDFDGDGLCGDVDNCPGDSNADQNDHEGDGLGDVCDDDDDDDGVLDVADNCPLLPNTGQYDRDGDLLGNVCDPTLVDFAPAGSSVPPGFLHADGSSYSSTTGHGWSQPVETRERASGGPAELKTFAFTQGVRHWTIEMLNGEYVVTVVLGDPSYPQGTQRVLANGVVVLDGVSTAASEFAEFEATVHVRNGLLELEVGGGSGLTTLNVLKIVAPDVPDEGISVNFQTPTAEVPDGYVSDTGQPYAGGFGWVVPMPTRERFQDVPQVRDTFVYSVLPETWELDILPGVYEVLVTAGDPTWAQGPQQVVVEGTTAIDGILTTTTSFAEALVLVHVTDGKLTVVIGGAGGLTTINQITVRPAPEDADGDGAPNSSDNCPLISNPAQLDQDSDGRGDPCDVCPNDSNDDSDGDGVCGDVDNCAVLPNPGQENLDGDALGDLCDPCPADADNDFDGDGLCGDVDNCPGDSNADQNDHEGDGLGDVCDDDDDDDGVLDVADNCPLLPNTGQYDRDGDLLGNVCDPTLVDFAPAGSSVPPGFLHADGSSYSSTTGHGWSQPVETRERASGGPAELKTFAFTQGVRHWTIEMLNGEYVVTVVLGDPSYPQGTQRVLANGVVVLDGVSTAASEFAEFEATVHVRNGLLELEVGGGSGLTTLNVLKIVAPDVPDEGISVNFQTPTAEVPDGYQADSGLLYDIVRQYGWNVPLASRERGGDVPQVLDTFVFSVAPATWELDLVPGFYEVLVSVGDPWWSQGPQQVVVEGTTLIDGVTTLPANAAEASAVVEVTDGKLTVVIGGAGGVTALNQVVVIHAEDPGD